MECPWDGPSLPTELLASNVKECPMFPTKPVTRSSQRLRPIFDARLACASLPQCAASELLRRFCSGRWPLWRLLAVRVGSGALLTAVEWCRTGQPKRFAVAELTFDGLEVRWRSFTSARATRAALRLLVVPTPDPGPIAANSVASA